MSEPVQPDREAIESPCIEVCGIDEQTGYCEGCGRTLDEIVEWSAYTPAERRRIIAELGQRDWSPSGDA